MPRPDHQQALNFNGRRLRRWLESTFAHRDLSRRREQRRVASGVDRRLGSPSTAAPTTRCGAPIRRVPWKTPIREPTRRTWVTRRRLLQPAFDLRGPAHADTALFGAAAASLLGASAAAYFCSFRASPLRSRGRDSSPIGDRPREDRQAIASNDTASARTCSSTPHSVNAVPPQQRWYPEARRLFASVLRFRAKICRKKRRKPSAFHSQLLESGMHGKANHRGVDLGRRSESLRRQGKKVFHRGIHLRGGREQTVGARARRRHDAFRDLALGHEHGAIDHARYGRTGASG